MPAEIDPKEIGEQVLRGLETGLELGATFVPGPGAGIMRMVAAGLGLVADLLRAGENGPEVITEMRSIMPDYAAAQTRLRQRIERLAKDHEGKAKPAKAEPLPSPGPHRTTSSKVPVHCPRCRGVGHFVTDSGRVTCADCRGSGVIGSQG